MAKRKPTKAYKMDVHLRLKDDPEIFKWLTVQAALNDRSLTAEARVQLRRQWQATNG